jgi:predicted HTH transcriptional regulator
VGSTNRRADDALIEELRRLSRGEGFDEQPLPGFGSEDLDFRAASESFARFRARRRRDLETLRLVGDHLGKTGPTAGGMILFGHDRERHFPDAWIQAGRFAGSDKSRILDRIEIHAFPVQAVEEAIAFV